jgi:hypothetical protein
MCLCFRVSLVIKQGSVLATRSPSKYHVNTALLRAVTEVTGSERVTNGNILDLVVGNGLSR